MKSWDQESDIQFSDEKELCEKRENGGEYLDNVSLFDIYQGEQVGLGKKSMAFNLVFVSYDRTLNVEEIDAVIQTILTKLQEKLKAELR